MDVFLTSKKGDYFSGIKISIDPLAHTPHLLFSMHQVQNHFDQFIFLRWLACCNHQGESSKRIVVYPFAAVFSQKNFVLCRKLMNIAAAMRLFPSTKP